MNRTPLLLETLVTRRITRPGPIYLYRRPAGPRPPKKESINRFLHRAAQHFDFGPIMTGDQQQARQVAGDYYQHLKQAAKESGISEKEIKDRLKEISPHLRRSLNTFFTYLDAKIKTT